MTLDDELESFGQTTGRNGDKWMDVVELATAKFGGMTINQKRVLCAAFYQGKRDRLAKRGEP